MSKPLVLFVDDEPNVLHGIRRSLRNDFEISTASSGQEALRLIGENPLFSAAVCDCRMPEMDGIELLQRIAKLSPTIVRVMLTGNIDQETAIRAVNSGEVFRFLTKPCEIDQLREVVQQAVRQHELVTAEKQLLEQTLKGSIGVLADLLSIVKPEAFGRTARIRRKAREIAEHLEGVATWQLDTAALLSQLGCMNVDQAVLDKLQRGEALNDGEAAEFAEHARLGAELIARIPRLDRVAEIVRYQNKDFDGGGSPRDGVKGDKIPLEARVLRAASLHDELRASGLSDAAIVAVLRKTPGKVGSTIIDALTRCIDYPQDDETVSVLPNELTFGMVIQQDVKTDQGVMLLSHGQEVTSPIVEHLLRFQKLGLLTKRLLVVRPGGRATRPGAGHGQVFA